MEIGFSWKLALEGQENWDGAKRRIDPLAHWISARRCIGRGEPSFGAAQMTIDMEQL